MSDVSTLLSRWQQYAAEDAEIAGSLYRTLMQAHMGGALFVREVEVPESRVLKSVALDAARPPPFLRQQFAEALDAFLRRRLVTPEVFQALSDEMRVRAFSMTLAASQHIIERSQQLLTQALADGGTLRGFVQSLRTEELRLGIEPASPHYLEVVYRNATQGGYGAGRVSQLNDPAVLGARPWVQYRTAGDSRVRASHAILDGKFINRAEDPAWETLAPPNGHNCRCAVIAVRTDRVDPSAAISSSSLPVVEIDGEQVVGQPDPGWQVSPLAPPDLLT